MKKKIINASATKEMDAIMTMLGEMFGEIENAFMKHRLSLKYQKTADEVGRKVRQSLVDFYEAAPQLGGEEALSVHATAINLSKVFYDLLRLAHQVETKVRNKVFFSDDAVAEVSGLMQRTSALLPHVADALRTCNDLITSHVDKEVDELRAIAANSTILHEDRLCHGKCHPKASIIYMQILQNLQDILWHLKALVCHNGIPAV